MGIHANTITASKGDRVKLTIQSAGVTHGISIPDSDINENLNPVETVNIEFAAGKAGTSLFVCSIYCGPGHSAMLGQTIVI